MIIVFSIGCVDDSSSVSTDPTLSPTLNTKNIGKTTVKSSISPTITVKIDNQDHTFIETITLTNAASRTVITKNKILKTATIDITTTGQKSENPRINELGVKLVCGALRLAYFNETAKEEFNNQMQQWRSQQYTITDDSPEEQKETTLNENPLEGYKVTSAKVQVIDESTNNQISECTITGPNVADVAVTLY